MLMVILGAGASYDSVNLKTQGPILSTHGESRPPLANQLFEPRSTFAGAIDRFKDMRPLVDRLRTAAAAGLVLEEVLQEIETEAEEYPARHRQLLAIRCYLRMITDSCARDWFAAANGVTNYHVLVDEVERWRRSTNDRVAYVSFNYDRMLEAALGDILDVHLTEMSDYLNPQFSLFKPHGSVDWSHLVGPLQKDLGSPSPEEVMFRFAGQYQLADDIEPNPSINSFDFDYGSQSWGRVPALALPVKDKREFAFPPAHLQGLVQATRMTTNVITIGWRGLERHFVDLWSTRNDHFKMLVVSKDLTEAQDTVDHLKAGGMSSRWIDLADGGFSDVAAGGQLRSFLVAPPPDFSVDPTVS